MWADARFLPCSDAFGGWSLEKKKIAHAWNCSQHGLWIIQRPYCRLPFISIIFERRQTSLWQISPMLGKSHPKNRDSWTALHMGEKYTLLVWGWTVPLMWQTNLILLIRKHCSFYRRLTDDIFLPLILRTGLLVSMHKGVPHMKPGNIPLSSPAHGPPSGPSSVPAARGRKHLGSVSSGKPSPAPPAGSWWTWCDCVSSCPCCSQPHSCPEGWRDPSLAARSAPSRRVPSGSGSCLPSQQGRRSGASQTLSGHCCLFLWSRDKERGRKRCGRLWVMVHCSFKLEPHQFDTVNVSANYIYEHVKVYVPYWNINII